LHSLGLNTIYVCCSTLVDYLSDWYRTNERSSLYLIVIKQCVYDFDLPVDELDDAIWETSLTNQLEQTLCD